MRRTSTRLFMTMLLMLMSVASWAYDVEVEGIYYNLDKTALTAEVTYETTSLDSYSGTVAIPETFVSEDVTYSVTSIGSDAFNYCTGLTSVTIPNSATSIGDYAFRNCSGLTSIIIPNSVTSIGEYAFRNCSSLTSVTIGNSVTSIESGTFKNCTSLTSVTIPGSVTSIGGSAFENCTSLTSVTIPNSVTSIGSSAFYGCQLRTIIAKQGNPTSEYKDSFSDNTKRHAQLYVPEGSLWTYVYNTSWYSIINIKEFAATEENVRNGAVYMIADEAGMNYQVYSSRTKSLSNVEYTFALDEEDEGTCWQIIENGSHKYLYNIGAKAYAALNSKGEIELSIMPTALDIKVTESGTTINGYNKMLVVNNALQPSPTAINSITSDRQPAITTYYDLSGRKSNSLQKGLNIVNGKKVIY